MDHFAQKIIQDHKHPLLKTKLLSKKFFLRTDSESAEQDEIIELQRNELHAVLSHQRANYRSTRVQAVWLPDLNQARVTKLVKNAIHNFGYQDRRGKHLYPEEVLFLLESNKLELQLDNIPLSIQETYDIVLKTPDITLIKYKVYKSLILNGFQVVRHDEMLRRLEKSTNAEETAVNEPTISIQESEVDDNNDESPIIKEMFEKLKQNRPRQYIEKNYTDNPDYYLFTNTNSNKTQPNYYLFIRATLPTTSTALNSATNIFAITTNETFAFYTINQIETRNT